MSRLNRRRIAGDATRERGFSLVEALVAMALLGGALSVLASLFAMAARANVEARRITIASVFARDKLEQLRAPTVSLVASPADALERNVDGFVDFLDASGNIVGTASNPPADASYVRRWAVRPRGPAIGDAVTLEVLVGNAITAAASSPDMSRRTGVHLASIARRAR